MGLQEMPVRPASLFLLGSMHIFGLIKKRKHIIDNSFKYFFKDADTKSGWKVIDNIISSHSMKKTIPIGVSPSKDSNIQDSQSTPFSLDRSDGSLAKIYSDFKEKDLFLNNDIEVQMQFDIDNTGREIEVIQARRMWDVVLFAYETLYEVETSVKLIKDSIIPILLSKKWIGENNPQTKSPAQLKFFGGDDIWGNITNDWELGLWDNTSSDITGNFSNISKFLVLSSYEDDLHSPMGNRQMPSTTCGGENEYGPIALKQVPWDSVKESLNDILNILISGDITSLWYTDYESFSFINGNIIQGNISTGNSINGFQNVENSDKFKYNLKVYNGINHIPRTWYRNVISAFNSDGFNVKLSNNEWNGSGFYFYYDKFIRGEYTGDGNNSGNGNYPGLGDGNGDDDPGNGDSGDGNGVPSVPNIEEAYSYTSLYSLGQLKSWCSSTPCGSEAGVRCEKDVFPCGNTSNSDIDRPYRRTTTIYGFRAFADPDDCCLIHGRDEGFCPETDVRSLIWYTSTYSTLDMQIIDKFPDQFRFFLPPGVISAGVNFFLPGSTKMGIVVRYRNPPEIPGDYSSWLWDRSHYPDLPWNIDFYFHPLDLEQEGVYLPNGNGIIKVLDFHYSEANPMPVEDSGWVYVKKLPFDDDQILDIRVTLKIHVPTFNAWYNNYTDWDENGDPMILGSGGETTYNSYLSSGNGSGSRYKDLDINSELIQYISNTPCSTSDVNCKSNINSPSNNKTYIYTETRTGFKDKFNPNDIKIVTGTDYIPINSSTVVEENKFTLKTNISNQALISGGSKESNIPPKSYFFIPPGTIGISAFISVPEHSKQGVVVRYSRMPDYDYNNNDDDNIWNKDYENITWTDYHEIDLISLKNEDAFIFNYRGKIKIFPDLKFETSLNTNEAGWVYIHQLPFNDNTIFSMQIIIQVNYEKYLNWYNSNYN